MIENAVRVPLQDIIVRRKSISDNVRACVTHHALNAARIARTISNGVINARKPSKGENRTRRTRGTHNGDTLSRGDGDEMR